MKKIAAVTILVFIVMLLTSCQEQNSADDKKTKIIFSENIRLKTELEKCSRIITSLNEKIESQQILLEQKQGRIELLQKETEQKIQQKVNSILKAVMDKNALLRNENQKLQTELKTLQNKNISE